MARISKPGLDYFPLDVNFFQDRKVRRISNRHHAAGIAALTSLLCLIYKEKGFYVAWNQDTLFDISQEVCCEEEERCRPSSTTACPSDCSTPIYIRSTGF
ncbi:DUF4373 domain-containing protein [Bacteroides thetaiotaomicron]|nr:DUF4373 domain-containing protein [Bacteroides thetaiotaomicron]